MGRAREPVARLGAAAKSVDRREKPEREGDGEEAG